MHVIHVMLLPILKILNMRKRIAAIIAYCKAAGREHLVRFDVLNYDCLV